MSQRRKEEEPLLPPWALGVVLRLGPLVVLAGAWYLLSGVLRLPTRYVLPSLIVLAIATLIYFGGRFYKPFHVTKEGRCSARGAKQRAGCRHFIPGARLGGGCGRLREDGRCRYVH